MESQRTVFTILIAFVILAIAYFCNEQIEFKLMLETSRQLYSLPAIKAKYNFVAAHKGNKTTGKCDKECSRFQDLVRNWDKFPNNTNKPIAAVYILAHRLPLIKNCLRHLDKYFINKFNYYVSQLF